MLLPPSIYENPVYPKMNDWLYIVPESDAVIAENMEVTEAHDYRFACGSYEFARTSSFGHVGKNVRANAYSSLAAYHAITLFPKYGWTKHARRKDVFYQAYSNKKIDPPIRRTAYVQIDHRDGNLVLLSYFSGQGVNMLSQLSENFSIGVNNESAPFKIRDFLIHADGIILASYAMNVTRESALGLAAQVRSSTNFDGG